MCIRDRIDTVCDSSASVIMANVDQAGFDKTAKTNKYECWITFHLVHELIRQGVEPSSIGVIMIYTQNHVILKKILDAKDVEVFGIERCDDVIKDCIIISCIKPNNKSSLNKEFNKINTAFARARRKLVIIGSEAVFKETENLQNYYEAVKAVGVVTNVECLSEEKEYCERNCTGEEFKLIQ
eukprot:TRINITY_DN2833_c0_g1_i2.p1 TRINITY_DN2833_c0_g1~~TRINITY_DN2833_c0_g1_i2.p1  ORF type:complete len:182 (+),score=37.51 TRINITY_DN2833_c0_g1_i2:48-593(+)